MVGLPKFEIHNPVDFKTRIDTGELKVPPKGKFVAGSRDRVHFSGLDDATHTVAGKELRKGEKLTTLQKLTFVAIPKRTREGEQLAFHYKDFLKNMYGKGETKDKNDFIKAVEKLKNAEKKVVEAEKNELKAREKLDKLIEKEQFGKGLTQSEKNKAVLLRTDCARLKEVRAEAEKKYDTALKAVHEGIQDVVSKRIRESKKPTGSVATEPRPTLAPRVTTPRITPKAPPSPKPLPEKMDREQIRGYVKEMKDAKARLDKLVTSFEKERVKKPSEEDPNATLLGRIYDQEEKLAKLYQERQDNMADVADIISQVDQGLAAWDPKKEGAYSDTDSRYRNMHGELSKWQKIQASESRHLRGTSDLQANIASLKAQLSRAQSAAPSQGKPSTTTGGDVVAQEALAKGVAAVKNLSSQDSKVIAKAYEPNATEADFKKADKAVTEAINKAPNVDRKGLMGILNAAKTPAEKRAAYFFAAAVLTGGTAVLLRMAGYDIGQIMSDLKGNVNDFASKVWVGAKWAGSAIQRSQIADNISTLADNISTGMQYAKGAYDGKFTRAHGNLELSPKLLELLQVKEALFAEGPRYTASKPIEEGMKAASEYAKEGMKVVSQFAQGGANALSSGLSALVSLSTWPEINPGGWLQKAAMTVGITFGVGLATLGGGQTRAPKEAFEAVLTRLEKRREELAEFSAAKNSPQYLNARNTIEELDAIKDQIRILLPHLKEKGVEEEVLRLVDLMESKLIRKRGQPHQRTEFAGGSIGGSFRDRSPVGGPERPPVAGRGEPEAKAHGGGGAPHRVGDVDEKEAHGAGRPSGDEVQGWQDRNREIGTEIANLKRIHGTKAKGRRGKLQLPPDIHQKVLSLQEEQRELQQKISQSRQL